MKLLLRDKYLFIFKFRILQNGVVGVRSDCAKGKHVFFLDLDNVNPRWLVEEIPKFQKKHEMADIYLIQSSETNFHLVELTQRTLGEVIDLQRDFGISNENYQAFSVRRGYWVLRCIKKVGSSNPRLVAVFPGKGKGKLCPTHAGYLKIHYNANVKGIFKGLKHKLGYDKYSTVRRKEIW